MSQRSNIPSVAQRLISMFVDHVIMTFTIALGCCIISLPILLLSATKINSEIDILGGGFLAITAFFLFSLYFNKDILNGQSPAKKILRLQVVDRATNEAANPLRCLLRNLTILIWPIEVIVILFSPSQRLGDKIANTKVVILDDTKEKKPLHKKEVFKALLTGIIMLAIFLCLSLTLQNNFLLNKSGGS